MNGLRSITDPELACLEAARNRLRADDANAPHAIAAAIRTASGRVHVALNLTHAQAWGEMCAETGAIAKATQVERRPEIVFSVAIDNRGVIHPPSAVCLDLFREYGPHCRIALPAPDHPGGAATVGLADLIAQRAAQARCLGVILAGGAARRMGGGDKGRLQVAGRPLLAHVQERLGPQVVGMALNANGDAGRFADLGLPVLPDSLPDRPGPLAGVLAGLDWAAERGARSIVTVAADTPFFPTDLVGRLIAHAAPSGLCLAASPEADGSLRRHPTFGLWPVSLREDLRAALKDGLRKVVLWTDRHQSGRAVFAAEPFDPFFNVNTPEDLDRAERLAQSLLA